MANPGKATVKMAMSALALGLVVSAGFAQVPPENRDELKCEMGTRTSLSKLATGVLKCEMTCLRAARLTSGPYGGCFHPYGNAAMNACLNDVSKGAVAKAQASIAKSCAVDCPTCYADSGNCPDGDQLVAHGSATNLTPLMDPAIHCREYLGTTPSAGEARCEDGVAKAFVKYTVATGKCYATCVKNAFDGKIPAGSCTVPSPTDAVTQGCLTKAAMKSVVAIDKVCVTVPGNPACYSTTYDSGAEWTQSIFGHYFAYQPPVIFCGTTTSTTAPSSSTSTPTTSTSSTTSSTTLPCPGGGSDVGGVCWYFGADGASCDATCAGVGMASHVATRTYAGSDGTDANCQAVAEAVGAVGSFLGSAPCPGGPGLGCVDTSLGTIRCTDPPTSFSGGLAGTRQMCACRACTGVGVGGYCWYAAAEVNCDDRCAAEGQAYDPATATYAGSDGTTAHCEAVLDALVAPGIGPFDTSACVSGAGCAWGYVDPPGAILQLRCTTPATTSSASAPDGGRACACQ